MQLRHTYPYICILFVPLVAWGLLQSRKQFSLTDCYTLTAVAFLRSTIHLLGSAAQHLPFLGRQSLQLEPNAIVLSGIGEVCCRRRAAMLQCEREPNGHSFVRAPCDNCLPPHGDIPSRFSGFLEACIATKCRRTPARRCMLELVARPRQRPSSTGDDVTALTHRPIHEQVGLAILRVCTLEPLEDTCCKLHAQHPNAGPDYRTLVSSAGPASNQIRSCKAVAVLALPVLPPSISGADCTGYELKCGQVEHDRTSFSCR